MPDYEIRLFHHDGTMALVHVCHHESDDAARAHATRLLSGLSRFEIRRDGEPISGG